MEELKVIGVPYRSMQGDGCGSAEESGEERNSGIKRVI